MTPLRLNARFDAWLTAPEPNAAGRVGLFRIAYCLFYLWFLSQYSAATLSEYPGYRTHLLLLKGVPHDLPIPWLEALESAVVGFLVLLMVGYKTRLCTFVVLVLGTLLEALHSRMDMEQASLFLVFFTPLFMTFLCGWGDTYSLDARIRRDRGLPPVDPADSAGWRYAPIRASLVTLSVMFLFACWLKMFEGGNWLIHDRFMANVALKMNIESVVIDVPLNPLGPLLGGEPVVYTSFQYIALAFEGIFWTALLSRRWRPVILSTALLFHAINALWLTVTFAAIFSVYLGFFDWQGLRSRWCPRSPSWPAAIPTSGLLLATVLITLAISLGWNASSIPRALFSLGHTIDWRTAWYPALWIGLIWLPISIFALLKGRRTEPRST